MKVATIYPNRISVTYMRDAIPIYDAWKEIIPYDNTAPDDTHLRQIRLKNLEQKRKTWKLSYQTKRKIKDSVQILNQLSKPRTVKTTSGKLIYNFRTAFITLTLPSKQAHNDKELKKCLNTFLTNLRKVCGLKNYVWKAELQKNANIHFHLAVDKYIPYYLIRYYWNLAINSLGYVDRYCQKMSKLSLKEYHQLRKKNNPDADMSGTIRAYNRGQKDNWTNPPTENVKVIHSTNQLAAYVSKYLAKSPKKEDDATDVERILEFGRMWGRSQSLSSFNITCRWNWEELRQVLSEFLNYRKFLKPIKYDYCDVIYFDFKKITKEFRRYIEEVFKGLAVSNNYPVTTP